MKKAIFCLVLAATTVFGAQAFAQDAEEGETRSRFYDFENMLVEGEFRSPDLMNMEGRGQAQFQRLLDLKTSFLPKIQESTEEAALQQ
ncbi:hypothetical protein FRC96_20330 [Lujinxingia vulgaris]|uniref:Uncharacterized protein n=2 Tax=Lujinxingia TaxID=2653226 RepID=A0A5C6XMU4_9DELT|nr:MULTISPECIES: hypothetical protein [Lujinxingia]RDV39997.1 hypothetical protein DV096_05415 [Bradymonadaceae bacterium TMQ3]TXC77257.1 hypothetical protein FRC91_00530 [Bradymonadales bacterium TMQ1]RVU47956.1 hypothetical protein EA187_00535 [Lujinxingia sediminis]TXD31820.1 hypothetical protein FRC96_20330 [Lujinxingia vulgaris]TXD38922.1 hypothetical protein FRC98_00535 [Lujinxingia vulgaris]